jgi:hypothetical protein
VGKPVSFDFIVRKEMMGSRELDVIIVLGAGVIGFGRAMDPKTWKGRSYVLTGR